MLRITDPLSPVGVFDSGVGGLSVLRALHAEMAQESFVYVADGGHSPYGERDDAYLLARAHAITHYLVQQHGVKALVIACNTATAAAIQTLRTTYPDLPIVGIEPALKPAAKISKTGIVGVMATRGTLKSEKFRALLGSLAGSTNFVLQPCDGLADAIERNDATKTRALYVHYTRAMGQFGTQEGEIDTLVLGCTHYPFIASQLMQLLGVQVTFLEGGTPVALQTRRLLEQHHGLNTNTRMAHFNKPPLAFFTTGNPDALAAAAQRWVGSGAPPMAVSIPNLTVSENLV